MKQKLNLELLNKEVYNKRLKHIDLADKTKLSTNTISSILNGKDKSYRKSTLVKVSKVLEVSYEDMFIKKEIAKIVKEPVYNNKRTRRLHILCNMVLKLDSIEKTINQLN